MEKTLTARPVPLADVLHLVQRAAIARADTTMGMQTVQDACHGAQAMAVDLDGVLVMAYAVQPVEHDRGLVLWVKAAGGHSPGVNLTRGVMPLIEKQAHAIGARQVALTTKRRGLAVQLQAMGYEVTGITLRKKIK